MLAAAANPTPDSRASVAALCKIYWPPIYAFIRRRGCGLEQAEDLTQAFFVALLEKDYLGDAATVSSASPGRTRTVAAADSARFSSALSSTSCRTNGTRRMQERGEAA